MNKFFSLAHILPVVVMLLLSILLYFIFRNAPKWLKFTIVYIISLLALGQHLFKYKIYDFAKDNGFNIENTALNFCACVEMLMPITLLFKKNNAFKGIMCLLAMLCGFLAVGIPHDLIGHDIFESQNIQYYICHILLFTEGFLGLSLDIAEYKIKNFYKVFLVCLLIGLITMFNDIIYKGIEYNDFKLGYDWTYEYNALWIMHPHPNEIFTDLFALFEKITPDFMLKSKETGRYLPILWYIIPMFIAINSFALITGLIFVPINKRRSE